MIKPSKLLSTSLNIQIDKHINVCASDTKYKLLIYSVFENFTINLRLEPRAGRLVWCCAH